MISPITPSESDTDTRTLGALLPGFLRKCKEGSVESISTGFRSLDAFYSARGWRPGELVVLAADTGQGKSALSLCMALEIARKGTPVGIVSYEMDGEEVLLRALCIESSIPAGSILRMSEDPLSKEDAVALQDAAVEIAPLPLSVADDAADTEGGVLKSWRQMGKPKVLIVDHLHLMGSNCDNGIEEVGRLTRAFKQIAQQQHIVLVVLAQVRKTGAEGKPRKPGLHDLWGASAIRQNANSVIFIHQPSKDKDPGAGYAEVYLAKNRSGAVGEIRLRWEPEITRFSDLSW